MTIEFKKVLPHPLKDVDHNDNSIWGDTFKLENGNKVMLNASSGKGKTTFTNLIAGVRKDYDGEILLNNESIADFSKNEWANLRRKELSFVFQDLQLFPKLSVAENLLLKNNLENDFSEAEIKTFLSDLGIADKWEKPCGILSMGQQQRVAIIRALIQPYTWLIMDEPFSHLDIENANLCIKIIEKRTKELNAGFILTTLGENHDINYDKTLHL